MANPVMKIDRPYARAKAFASMPIDAQRIVQSRSRRSELRRIASISAAWGEHLDELGASHAQLRWLAGARTVGAFAQQEARYRVLRAFLKRGGTWKEWAAEAASCPKLGVQALVEANRQAADARRRPHASSSAPLPHPR